MAKKRLNVTEVAEVLVNEIDEFKAESDRLRESIDRLRNSNISISEGSLRKYESIGEASLKRHEEVNLQIEQSMKNFEKLLVEQNKFVPKWYAIALLVSYFISAGLAIAFWMLTKT